LKDVIYPVAFRLKLFQRPKILPENRFALYAILQAFEMALQGWGNRSGQRINHPVMMTVSLHQTVLLHAREVLGDLGLSALKNLLKMADAKWPLPHQIENSEPSLIAKALVNPNEFHLPFEYRCLTICVNKNIDWIPTYDPIRLQSYPRRSSCQKHAFRSSERKEHSTELPHHGSRPRAKGLH